jgi:hypothetical protein
MGRQNSHGTSPSLFASTRRSTRPFCAGVVQAARLPGWQHRGNAEWPLRLAVPSGSGQRADEIARVGGGSLECLVGRLGSERGSSNADDLDVGHAEEAEHVSEPGNLEIECRVFAGVNAAARAHNDHSFPGDESLRASLAVAERASGARDIVEPGLQRCAEVDHWRRDDDDVGGEQIVDQSIRFRKDSALVVRACATGVSRRSDGIGVDVRERILRKFAHGQCRLRIGLPQLVDDAGGDSIRVGRATARATADVEDIAHGFAPLIEPALSARWAHAVRSVLFSTTGPVL